MNRHLILKALELNASEETILKMIGEQKIAVRTSKIATLTGIPWSSALYTLEKLSKWKLIRKVRSGKRQLWLGIKT